MRIQHPLLKLPIRFCAETLARDLAAMPSLRPVRAQLLDMFPHTPHYEVLVLLRRGTPAGHDKVLTDR